MISNEQTLYLSLCLSVSNLFGISFSHRRTQQTKLFQQTTQKEKEGKNGATVVAFTNALSHKNTFYPSQLDTTSFLNGPIPASFCLFSLFSHYNFNKTNWKKHRWCAWDSNLGLQDGRRRQNHGAMAATQTITLPLIYNTHPHSLFICWLRHRKISFYYPSSNNRARG